MNRQDLFDSLMEVVTAGQHRRIKVGEQSRAYLDYQAALAANQEADRMLHKAQVKHNELITEAYKLEGLV